MKLSRKFPVLIGVLMLLAMTAGLSLAQDETTRPETWDDSTHSNAADPNYEVVFPQEEVNTVTITISPENWAAMQADMTELYGEYGSRTGQGGMMGGNPGANGQMPEGAVPPDGQMPPDGEPPAGMGQRPDGAGGMGGMLSFAEENPIWVPVTVEFEGETWTNVGMRFKGNSSLSGTWGEGNLKLPFKLDFDEFEDTYPEIENQRFYGFKELSFSSNFRDASYLHEKVAADIFREAGIPSAQTAFYAVYVDYGEGPVYFGLYTGVEVIDDTVLETQFTDDSGNLYKPEGASFAAGSFDEANFEKETNEDEADYSDIQALIDALNAETRTTDPAAWRSNLEAVLNVDEFIHWLAVNTVIQNWDTYGTMAHNFYLYHDPTTGLLTWIPWDNNEALSGGGMGMGRRGGAGTSNTGAASVSLDNISDEWVLIRYIMDDPVYQAVYADYVEATISSVFDPAKMTATYQALHDMIAPYITGETGLDMQLESVEAFTNSLTQLITHVNERHASATEYLNNQGVAQ